MGRCHSFWAQFHWQVTKCQTLHHTRMHRNNYQLQFKIHRWPQRSQSHQPAHPAASMEPDGIFIHRFVSGNYPTVLKFILSSNSYIVICVWFAAAPTFTESDYRANIANKNDSQYMRTAGGQSDFAPRYPVYTAQTLPPLPNTQS